MFDDAICPGWSHEFGFPFIHPQIRPGQSNGATRNSLQMHANATHPCRQRQRRRRLEKLVWDELCTRKSPAPLQRTDSRSSTIITARF